MTPISPDVLFWHSPEKYCESVRYDADIEKITAVPTKENRTPPPPTASSSWAISNGVNMPTRRGVLKTTALLQTAPAGPASD